MLDICICVLILFFSFKVYDYFAIISMILMIFGGKDMAFTCLEGFFFFVDAPP